jgi:hypothetical protein
MIRLRVRLFMIILSVVLVMFSINTTLGRAAEQGKGKDSKSVSSAKKASYPWRCVIAVVPEGGAPFFKTGFALEVFVDFGRTIFTEELLSLRTQIKLIDAQGTEHLNVGGSDITRGKTVMHGYTANNGMVGFFFNPQIKSQNYKLYFKDYPPLDIGNPFKSVVIRKNK